jgi:hypothetical protein
MRVFFEILKETFSVAAASTGQNRQPVFAFLHFRKTGVRLRSIFFHATGFFQDILLNLLFAYLILFKNMIKSSCFVNHFCLHKSTK